MRFKSITFDLDGTLLDTVGDLAAASRNMLNELGLPLRSDEEIRRFVGRGVVVLVQRCLERDGPVDEVLFARAVDIFRRHYAEINGQYSRPFPGVIAGLEAWRATQLPLSVVTNKAAAFTEPLLERTGLRQYFDVVVSGDTTPHAKPHPAPLLHACQAMGSDAADNLHIGDSKHDIETARRAGCTVCCVPYGYNEGEILQAGDCDGLVDDLTKALEWARTA